MVERNEIFEAIETHLVARGLDEEKGVVQSAGRKVQGGS